MYAVRSMVRGGLAIAFTQHRTGRGIHRMKPFTCHAKNRLESPVVHRQIFGGKALHKASGRRASKDEQRHGPSPGSRPTCEVTGVLNLTGRTAGSFDRDQCGRGDQLRRFDSFGRQHRVQCDQDTSAVSSPVAARSSVAACVPGLALTSLRAMGAVDMRLASFRIGRPS